MDLNIFPIILQDIRQGNQIMFQNWMLFLDLAQHHIYLTWPNYISYFHHFVFFNLVYNETCNIIFENRGSYVEISWWQNIWKLKKYTRHKLLTNWNKLEKNRFKYFFITIGAIQNLCTWCPVWLNMTFLFFWQAIHKMM